MASNEPPNLAISTSLSTLSSSSCVLSMPQNATLHDLYLREKLTPPAKAEQFNVIDMKERVDELFGPLCQHYWNTLDSLGQAKISYLLMRQQDKLLLQVKNPLDTAQAIQDSLNVDTFYGKRLNAFIRKGGDIVVEDNMEYSMKCPLEKLLANGHDEFLDPDNAPTIFNHREDFNRVKKPLLWLQEETSTVCYLVTMACAIFYSQCMHNGTTVEGNDVAVGQYALNISRFMRDQFSNEEVFANIFLGQDGYPEAMLERLLQPQNPGVRVLHHINLRLNHSNLDFIFEMTKCCIRDHGALLVPRFKLFEGFSEDDKELVFHGDWNDKQPLPNNPTHALLIVGVRRTSEDEMGGLTFLLQNSWAKKPFVILGLDLFRSMVGADEVVGVKEGLKFDTGEWKHDPVSPAFIQSGGASPRIFDVPESPRIATDKEDDMVSRFDHYWTRIDPDKIAYIIT